MEYLKKAKFSFEDLAVWQKAVEFANNVINLAENIHTDRRHFRLIEQLEAASTSIALNISEGKGKQAIKQTSEGYQAIKPASWIAGQPTSYETFK